VITGSEFTVQLPITEDYFPDDLFRDYVEGKYYILTPDDKEYITGFEENEFDSKNKASFRF